MADLPADNSTLHDKIAMLPTSPGVYRYLDGEGRIIYVGKAKNLRRRVSSYFNREHTVLRTTLLVRNIRDLEFTVVNSEEEALDLENALIKTYQPRYNVLLKDDKSYPWIAVTKELYPRVFITRDKPHRGARFFGPYPKAEVAHSLIDTLRRMYPLRTCRHVVSRETIEGGKHRLCLQYHIKRCEGCCRGMVTPEQYGTYIGQVVQILNGETRAVSDYLMNEMQRLAGELRFEEAEALKRRYRLLEHYRAHSVIVSPTVHNIDVLAIAGDEHRAWVNHLLMREGSVVRSITLEYRKNEVGEDNDDSAIMARAMSEVRSRFGEVYKEHRVREAVVNVLPEVAPAGVECIVPQRGDKRRLMEIALKNAEQARNDHYARQDKLNPEQRNTRLMKTMQRDLHLDNMPRHIECFDNSNIGGSDAVASCVVFNDGKPSKRDYRHFIIKEAAGNDDYGAMREVITRRYTRLSTEGEPLPQLIVVDGGKGQLSAAVEALDAMGLRDTIAVVGLAKRLDEVYFAGDELPYNIDRNSETLRVLQHLRDESHRFAITFHRSRRSRGQVRSALDDIKGIGPKTREALLKHFKSVKRVREASVDELATVIGDKKALTVKQALQPNEGDGANETHEAQ